MSDRKESDRPQTLPASKATIDADPRRRKPLAVSIRGTSLPRGKSFHHVGLTPLFHVDFSPFKHVFYDEDRRTLILIKSGRPGARSGVGCLYFTLSLQQEGESRLSEPIDHVQDGDVLSVKLSVTRRFMAIQRSSTDVDIVDLKSRTDLRISCRYKTTNRLLLHGVCWCKYTADTDALILITRRGVEIHRLALNEKEPTTCLHMRTIKQKNVGRFWFVSIYASPTSTNGVVLLGTGDDCRTVRPLILDKFSPGSSMPTFELGKDARDDDEEAADDVTRTGDASDAKRGGWVGWRSRKSSSSSASSGSPLESRNVRLLSLYRRLYCAHLRRLKDGTVCDIYLVSKDRVSHKHTLPLYTTAPCTLQVLDNLLVVHNAKGSCTMLFDLKAHKSRVAIPVVNPLPVGMRSLGSGGRRTVPIVRQWCPSKRKIPEFDVVFSESGPLGMELSWPGSGRSNGGEDGNSVGGTPTLVYSFHRGDDDAPLAAERSGRIAVGDYLVAVNGETTLDKTSFEAVLGMIRNATRPITLRFQQRSRFSNFTLEEAGDASVDPLPSSSSSSEERYADHWQYLWPRWVMDRRSDGRAGTVWRLDLQLPEIIRSSIDPTLAVPLVQRRRRCRETLQLLLKLLRTLIRENTPLPSMYRVFYELNQALHAWNKESSKRKGDEAEEDAVPRTSGGGLLVVRMETMFEEVFSRVVEEEEEGSDHRHHHPHIGGDDESNVATLLLEYLRSLLFHRMRPLPCLFELVAKLLVRRGDLHVLYQFMQYHLQEDSSALAEIAWSAGRARYPPLKQLAVDTWHRLGMHETIVVAYLESREIVTAMHVVRRHPSAFAYGDPSSGDRRRTKLMRAFLFHTLESTGASTRPVDGVRRLRLFFLDWLGGDAKALETFARETAETFSGDADDALGAFVCEALKGLSRSSS